MMYTLLLLGLLPLAVLPDFLGQDDDAGGDDAVEDMPAEGGNGDIFDPVDGGDGDDGVEPGDDAGAVLHPVNEDDVAGPGEDPAGVLQPVDEDDTSPGGEDPDNVLAPVDEDDQPGPPLSPMAQDQAAGGGSEDVIVLDFSDPDTPGYAEVDGFAAGHDVLHIVVDANSIPQGTELGVSLTENGADTEVYVEDLLVAVLRNATDIGEADVLLEIGTLAA